MNTVLVFALILAAVSAMIMIFHLRQERKSRHELKKKFKKFSKTYGTAGKNQRSRERVAVPEGFEVRLTLTGAEFSGLTAQITDISRTGLAVKPNFPLKKIPDRQTFSNSLVRTPLNHFVIKELRHNRIEHQVKKRVMAFEILNIDPEEGEKLDAFLGTLEEFLTHEN